MKLVYQQKGNNLYAKVPGKSYRAGGKVQKKEVVYLGRVVDKENNIFCNKERGVFTYNPETGEYGDADPAMQSGLKNDRRRKPKLILDFGDAYFTDALIRKMGYDSVLDSIGYANRDTVWAMTLYYVLTNTANMHAKTWCEGSFASVLYPEADLHSQRISRFLSFLGKEETRRAYFTAHVEWIKKHVCDDPAIIVDSTGLPNAIRMDLTQTNCHNGKISNEARMATAIQRDSGYPLLFRALPGNIVDVTALQTTIVTLAEYGIKTDMALLDAGYVSAANIDALLKAGIDFVARLPETSQTLYRQIVSPARSRLKREENLVEFNGRYVYIEQTECRMGDHTLYGFACFDVDASADANHKAIKRSLKKKKKEADMHRIFEQSGWFALIASLPFQPDDILDVYYVRQLVEQYFDVEKGISRLTPLRVHNAQRVYGHLLLSQIAATVNLYIQKTMKTSFLNSEEMFMGLRNQKCNVYATRIVTNEGQSDATKYYKKFKINYPTSFDTAGPSLKPEYGISFAHDSSVDVGTN